jgi:DNA polymerase-3 subunit alpha
LGSAGSGRGRFAHLHLHTQYSILDGAIPIEALVEHCAAAGMPAAAITDHGNMFGVVQFHEACRRRGVRPILGCEVYVAQGSRFEKDASTGGFEGINHLILLAMNATGYRNLIQLVSRGYLEGFYYKPRIDWELLERYHEGLIATSGCLSGAIPRAIADGKRDRAWALVERYARLFEDRFYLELQRHGIADQERVNRELLGMHRDLGLPVLATNDCHYLRKGDAHAHEALLCVQTGKTLDDPSRFRFDGEGFFVKTAEEMLEVFHDLPEAVLRTVEVAERCDFELPTGQALLPEFEVPSGENAGSYLARLAGEGLRERLGLDPEAPFPERCRDYEQRLAYELDVLGRKGYAGYFLIVWDMIRFARSQGIPVGPGRGSAAGSLAAYALKIVDIDPVEYRIPFERFLNPERPSMPDFDIDFCMNRRAEVIRYVEQKYNGPGEGGRRVAGIVTFGTMQARAAVRDCGRVLGLSFAEVDRVAKLIPETLGIRLEEALAQSHELRQVLESDPRYQRMMELALGLEGQIRNPGKHAAGIVISSRPLLETAPLYRDPRTREVVTQLDYRDAERVGLIKFDLLGLRTLTVIHATVSRVRGRHRPDFRIEDTPLDDAETYALLRRGDTDGVFQLSGSGMADLVVRLEPRHFRDLIPAVALYRPGTIQAGVIDDFVNRRHGRTPVTYLLPELEDVLAETYGVIVYQDQVLQIANRIAGYTLGEGDLLRRAMGKKIPAEMEAQRARFVQGAVDRGHPRDRSEQLFDLIYLFSGYGFGKAHSVTYALITHQTAYLKAHYPAEFYAAAMSAEWRETDKLDRYLRDAAKRGIRMLGPSVNESEAEFSVTDDGEGVRFGLFGVKNVGEGAVGAILRARKEGGVFAGLHDFCARIDLHQVNRRVIESLIRCGAFDLSGTVRAALLEALPAALERGQQRQRDLAVGQGSLFDLPDASTASEPPLPATPEWDRGTFLAGEKEMLGFYVSGHPLEDHVDVLRRFTGRSVDSLSDGDHGKSVRLGGLLVGLATQKTRRGDLMARARFEDLTGALSVVIFPSVYERHAATLRQGGAVFLDGVVQAETQRVELRVDDVIPLAEIWSRATRELRVHLTEAAAADEARLLRLRELLDLAPGGAGVCVSIELAEGGLAELSLRAHRVEVSEALVRGLERLFGPDALECRS